MGNSHCELPVHCQVFCRALNLHLSINFFSGVQYGLFPHETLHWSADGCSGRAVDNTRSGGAPWNTNMETHNDISFKFTACYSRKLLPALVF